MRFYLFRTGHMIRTPISYLISEKGHVAQLHLRPMTNAQRQTAYRQCQRVASITVTVTKIAIRRIKCRPCAPSWRRVAASLLSCGFERDRLSASAGNESAASFEVMLKLLAMACSPTERARPTRITGRHHDQITNGQCALSAPK